MISQEAKEISAVFAKLRECGCWVYNFNTYKRMQESMNRFCDHLVIGESGVHFIEVKLLSTKDTEKPHQKLFAKLIQRLASYTDLIHYWKVIDMEEAEMVFGIAKDWKPDGNYNPS